MIKEHGMEINPNSTGVGPDSNPQPGSFQHNALTLEHLNNNNNNNNSTE